MRCDRCGSEWKISGTFGDEIEICPFCKTPLQPKESTVKESLRWVVQSRGIEVFRNSGLINSILADLASDSKSERRKIKNALAAGAGEEFYRIIESDNQPIANGQRQFTSTLSENGFTEEFCSSVWEIFAYSVGSSENEEIGINPVQEQTTKEEKDEKEGITESKNDKTAPSFSAWGPARIDYTMTQLPQYVVYNSIVDDPLIGNEKNFVRVRDYESGNTYRDAERLQSGKEYEILLFYHNNADVSLKKNTRNAQSVFVSVRIPQRIEKDKTGVIKGFISAANANPAIVWDSAFVIAEDGTYVLQYVPNTAYIYTSEKAQELNARELLSIQGVNISSDMNEKGYITLRIIAVRI